MRIGFLLCLFLLTTPVFYAQDRKAMDHYVYEKWHEIENMKITSDGNFAFYEVNLPRGDGRLELFNLKKKEMNVYPRCYGAEASYTSTFMAARIKPPYLLARAAKKDGKKGDALPSDSLLVINLRNLKTEKYENVRSFAIPEKNGEWLVFHHSYKPEDKGRNTNENSQTDLADFQDKNFLKISKKYKLADLVILNPLKSKYFSFENVSSYAVSENGSTVVFHQFAADSVESSVVYAFDTGEEELEIIFEGKGNIDKLCIDREGKKSAFLFLTDTTRISGVDLYCRDKGSGNSILLCDSLGRGLRQGWGVNKYGKLYFSGEGDRLYFGTSPVSVMEKKDSLLKDEKASLDIWSWKDSYIQPMQKKRLKEEKEKSFLTFFYFPERKMVHLADPEVDKITTMDKGDGSWMIGEADGKYAKFLSWEGIRYHDVYLVNAETGDKQLILEKQSYPARLSPSGKFIIYYLASDSSWYSYNIGTGTKHCLTCGLKVAFYEELNDVPQEPSPYGIAGFTQEDSRVLIYDRYDIWSLDPTGTESPVCLTAGNGRKKFTVYRYIQMDKDEKFIDTGKSLYFSLKDEKSREEGIAVLNRRESDQPVTVLAGPFDISQFMKARDKDVFLYRKGDFDSYPDVYFTTPGFSRSIRISDANPQASEYLWGSVELVHWKSYNNDNLDGLLYIPENPDTTRKYPMLVYFYERSSQGLYNHRIPSPSRSTINIPWCVSNGYVVFVPDIVYRTGYPGQSAYDAVVSGTLAMTEKYNFIDRENIGIQGQSWGGYQVAYLVTRTGMFKAAMAGAPVSNMTSAYGGVRWGTGMSRMFQYEKTQSRIGASLWEEEGLYIENSPLFFAPNVETPLLIMHNDNDGAVPWYQGIEFFLALRRLEKPVWMLSYNDEEHNLTKWPNRVDISIRMMQFFDHYLKGLPEPDWMKYGVPQIDKGKNNAYSILE